MTANFGYMETPNVPHVLRLLDPRQTEGRIAVDGANYFLSNIELVKGTAPTMSPWRKYLFIARPISPPTPPSISPTAGSHGDHGLANRGVARLIESAQNPCRGLPPEDQSQNRTSPWGSNEVLGSLMARDGRVEQGCCGGEAIQDCGAMEYSFRGVSKYTGP